MLPENIYLNILLFIFALVIIIKGSDFFLDSAIWIAETLGIPHIVVGATIVSLCTTLPELVSSITASLKGTSDMAMGNAVGSIICNSSFILGTLFVLMAPVPIHRRRFLFKGFALFIALLAGLGVAIFPGTADGVLEIGRGAGLGLLFLCVVYLVCNYLEVKSEKPSGEEESKVEGGGGWRRNLLLFSCGALMVSVGAFMLIDSGQKIASGLGVKESIVSLVFIALGTSLPELITAITAWRKGAHDISVGNIFGANILNIVLVVGTAASISPLRFNDSGLIRIDLPICLGLTTALLLIGGIKATCFRRWVGIMLLCLYVGYLASLVLLHRVAL